LPNVGEINEFNHTAQEAHFPGISWWCWDDHGIEEHPDWLAAISAHDWGNVLPPPLSWEWQVTKALTSLGFKITDPG